MSKRGFNKKNIQTGLMYFYLHFVTEVVCFYSLYRFSGSTSVTWLLFLAYDMLAFVPQSVLGYLSDRFPRLIFSLIGLPMLAAALILQSLKAPVFISLFILCIGNCLIHVNGAEVTLRTSDGSLSHSAIFVSGGSFGVITGRLLSGTELPFWLLIILIASAVPFAILAQGYVSYTDSLKKAAISCSSFNYSSKTVSRYVVILLAVFVVIIRGYMGYGIPTSWNKTTLQTVLLFVFMGIGKAFGGILSDLFGLRKVAVVSVILALPLLLVGDNNMYISLLGVMFFSMTMSVTLAILVSVLPKNPGLAFGYTTIGLFLGTAPMFFFKIKDPAVNMIILSALTVVCIFCLYIALRKENDHESVV